MSTLKKAQRVFKMGSVELADPDPSMTTKQVIELYAANYPQLRNSTVSDPQLIADRLVYSFELPPVKTKG